MPMIIRAGLAIALLGPCAAAGAEVPLPRPKPAELRAIAAPPLPRPKPPELGAGEPPLPRAKPPHLGTTGSPPLPPPEPEPALRPAPSTPGAPQAVMDAWPPAEIAAAKAECQRLLSGRDMTWKPEAPLGESGGCGTPAPVSLSEAAGVRIDPPAILNCAMAAAVHDWLAGSVQPAARREHGSPVAALGNASSYVCRRRNNSASGKLSEHARANALDIAGFVLDSGARIAVSAGWGGFLASLGLPKRGGFMQAVRKGSCDHFNTVLGPGSDPFHDDHLHLDMMKLRPGRGKMCR